MACTTLSCEPQRVACRKRDTLLQYKKVRKPTFKYKRKATEILHDKMIFYNAKAQEIANFIISVIESGKMARGDLLAQIHKDMHRFNDIVIECASKLAPYQSPKLETVEVKQKITHRFVVAAPKPIANTQSWLNEINQSKVNGKLIDHVENTNISETQ